ncbi:MAG: L-threonylcarbamoyladenylate synthase [Nanoarchaeota archaeon]
MDTRLFRVDPLRYSRSTIKEAAAIIEHGGLVAFPTETVYGLGANGLDERAVKKIFLAKGRPQDNPLILHVSGKEHVKKLVERIPEKAKRLMDIFWPGPLSIILKKSDLVPEVTSGGLDSIAVRMPQNAIALALIEESGCPLAAPSANLSGKPSPTSAQHVIDDMDSRIDAIIDGGDTNIGIESTVLDMTQDTPLILRPGKITREQLEHVVGEVKLGADPDTEKPRSPGMKYKHYSPEAEIKILWDEHQMETIMNENHDSNIRVLTYENETDMGKNLFKDFRESDRQGYDMILIAAIEDEGFGHAIMDKIRKASVEKDD